MNRVFSFSFRAMGLILFLVGCERPPELPAEPRIEFENVDFKLVPNAQDSLIVTIRFEDGDGDLGLEPEERFPPFHELGFILESGVVAPLIGEAGELLVFDNSASFSDLITFSETGGIPPFSNNDWLFAEFLQSGDTLADTVRIERNENFQNFFVEFLMQSGDGYEKIDLIQLLGTNFDGRFQRLNIEPDERPLEGTLRYSMRSFGFLINPILRNATLRLNIQIQDRALNKSNIVQTEDFRISQLAFD